MRRAALLVLLMTLAGCADAARPSFPPVADPDDDDSTAPDDDDAGDDDDSTAPDDDDATFDPCGEFTSSADAPPVIDHGGDVGTIAYQFQAACSTSGMLRELFGGWVDPVGNGLDVGATFPDEGILGEAEGRVFPVTELEAFVAELDLGEKRYLPPTGLGGVYVATFVDGTSWQACFYGHLGVWTEEGGTATALVPDPLQFVCSE